ncbi:MAG: hypothetical protein ABR906_10440 [Terracidiphilus sp.]
MKAKFLLAAAFTLLLALPPFANATPACVRGTLASYIALGAGGCIFDNALYNNFTYGPTSTVGVSPADIIVTPILLPTATLFPGLNFTAPWKVAAGQSEQSVIGYKATPYYPGASPVPDSGVLTLDLGQSQVSGIIGSVTVQETTTMTSTTGTLEVYEICADACTIKQRDSVTITPAQTLQTTITVSLSGGNGGASLSSFASDYAIGPQPE